MIEHAFALAQTPITRQQFTHFVDATGTADWSIDDWERRSHKPMINVCWHDAQAYKRWLSVQLGANYSLPTELMNRNIDMPSFSTKSAAFFFVLLAMFTNFWAPDSSMDEAKINGWRQCGGEELC